MKILITGGHLSPALSVFDKLKKEDILYVGRKYALEADSAFSFEYQTIKDLGIPFSEITTARLQRKFTRYTLLSFLKFPVGFFQSFSILKKFKPDVVLGFGSYVSIPVIISAFIFRIPIVIHEQTLEAGMANKIAGFFANKICISWESSGKYFPKKKTVLTGNPLRKEIMQKYQRQNNSLPFLFITGGSLGSHFINQLVEKSLDKLINNFQILHQTGDAKEFNDFENLSKLKESLGKNSKRYILKKFLTPPQSAEALSNADIVVGRAGINTVSELLFLGKPSLLIPLSFSQNNEQYKNALIIKDQKLGEILEEKDANPQTFVSEITKILNNLSSYQENGKKSHQLFNRDSAEEIVKVVNKVYEEKKN